MPNILGENFVDLQKEQLNEKIQTIEKNVAYWLDITEYELDTAQAMLKSYPDYKERLIKKLTQNYCKQLLDQTKEFQLWIKSKL